MASIGISRQDLGIFSNELPKIAAALGAQDLRKRTQVGRYILLDQEKDPPFPFQGKYKKLYYCISVPLKKGEFNIFVAAQSKKDSSESLRERQVLTLLKGVKGILQPLSIEQVGNFDYLISELFNRGDLRTWIGDPQNFLALADSHKLAMMLVDAVKECHARRIILRDLKPENILVKHLPNGTLELNLIDFGLSFLIDQDSEQEAVRSCYSPSHLAPEEWAYLCQTRQAMPASYERDMWALGAILYALQLRQTPSRTVYQDQKFVGVHFSPPTHLPLGIFSQEIIDLIYSKKEERPLIDKIQQRMSEIFKLHYPGAERALSAQVSKKTPLPLAPDTPLLPPVQFASIADQKKKGIWSFFCSCCQSSEAEARQSIEL